MLNVFTRRRKLRFCLFTLLPFCFAIYVIVAVRSSSSPPDDTEITLDAKRFKIGFLKSLQEHNESSLYKHEVLLRRSKNNLVELGYTLEKGLKLLKKNSPQNVDDINKLQFLFDNQLQAALVDVEDLSALNENWRTEEANNLQNLVQQRLNYLQNPKDCGRAKLLICRPLARCGFACEIHHLTYCFMVAYQLGRTLVVEKINWNYHEKLNDLFLPISNTCIKSEVKSVVWNGEATSQRHQAVQFPVSNGMVSKRPQTGIPADLAPRLLRLHGNPLAWWNGQFLKYLTSPVPSLEKEITEKSKLTNFQTPCVGIHVRRTDKLINEASFHSIEEYMKHVIAWYDKLDLRLSKEKPARKATRRVYLASDDSSVLSEARKKFPNYIFFPETSNEDITPKNRYQKNGLRNFLVDLFMLAKCDYLVCTLSSGVGRFVYELMQTLHPDASDFFHSLDDEYWYIGQTAREEQAAIPHEGRDEEFSFDVGDLIGIAGNHWDGQSKGTHMKTKKVGLYPSHKMEKIYQIVNTSLYLEASNYNITR